MKHITIFGAGLVGSLLTVYLAKRGYKVSVYERRADPRKNELGAGRSINLAMSDRGWRALEKVGVDKKIAKIAIPMRGRMIHDTEGNLTFQPYGTENQAIFSVSRGGLNLALIQEADSFDNVTFYFDHKCQDVELENASATVLHNKETKHIKADLIIGADGAFSVVRQALMRTDRFNFSQYYIPHGYKEICMPAAEHGGYRLEKNALHIWPRGKLMLIALPNLDKSFTCTLFLPFEGEDSFEKLQNKTQVKAFFEKKFPDALQNLPNLIDEFSKNPTSSLLTVRASPWVYENKIALIGDAAHAIVPFYGQGMNAGFEDCFVLNQLLDKYKDNWEKTLSAYQEARIENANAISELALQNFVEMRDSVANEKFLLRKKIEAYMHQLYPTQWIPLYTMVTFSDIPYAEALRIGKKQAAIMDEVMSRRGIEENWRSMDFAQIVDKLEME